MLLKREGKFTKNTKKIAKYIIEILVVLLFECQFLSENVGLMNYSFRRMSSSSSLLSLLSSFLRVSRTIQRGLYSVWLNTMIGKLHKFA